MRRWPYSRPARSPGTAPAPATTGNAPATAARRNRAWRCRARRGRNATRRGNVAWGSAFPGEAGHVVDVGAIRRDPERSEEHTSELQSLMRISYAVFCLKKKNK